MTATPCSEPPTSNREPATCNSAPFLAHRRTGKVARLPAELRDLMNLMLHDGASYPRIINKLAERGHSLNVDSISRWHAGGYQDWLQDQAWLEEVQARLDFAGKVVHESNGSALHAPDVLRSRNSHQVAPIRGNSRLKK